MRGHNICSKIKSSLIRIYTVCPDIYVPIFRIFTVDVAESQLITFVERYRQLSFHTVSVCYFDHFFEVSPLNEQQAKAHVLDILG